MNVWEYKFNNRALHLMDRVGIEIIEQLTDLTPIGLKKMGFGISTINHIRRVLRDKGLKLCKDTSTYDLDVKDIIPPGPLGRPKAELSNKTFGSLTVIGDRYDDSGIRKWACLCVCGKIINLRTGQLTRRCGTPTRSCGCQQHR